MITPDHVRDLVAGHHASPVLIYRHDGSGAVVVEIAGCGSVDGWVVAVPEELEPPNEPEQQWVRADCPRTVRSLREVRRDDLTPRRWGDVLPRVTPG
ncbi:MAG: hypothetical protein ACXVXP_15420 [Mycobacteriaceae bacterium]